MSNTGNIPPEIAMNLKDFLPEHGDLSPEEIFAQQESIYLSLQGNGRNRGTTSASGAESSWHGHTNSQEALDEAIARSFQELGQDFEDFYIAEHNTTVTETIKVRPKEPEVTPTQITAPTGSASQHPTQDDIDPDNMSYEQLQELGDHIGTESRGLSEEVISRIPSFKYKTGMFSKNKKKEECVVCCMEYKNRENLTNLPCAHQYHSDCIKKCLKLNKACPVCKMEVDYD